MVCDFLLQEGDMNSIFNIYLRCSLDLVEKILESSQEISVLEAFGESSVAVKNSLIDLVKSIDSAKRDLYPSGFIE